MERLAEAYSRCTRILLMLFCAGVVMLWPAFVAASPAQRSGTTQEAGMSFVDGFEDGMTHWTVVSGWRQTMTWAATSYRASTGSRSAYCVGTDVMAPGPYPDNVVNEIAAGPFDLSGTVAGTLEFDAWVDCPPYDSATARDFVWVGLFKAPPTSEGGDGSGTVIWGKSAGWSHYSIDLTKTELGNLCGSPHVWIGLQFFSDASNQGEGAYVDNVRLTAIPPVPAPTIASFTPTAGAPGTVVTITGSGLAGATLVDFNGAGATFTVAGATALTAAVPADATSGPIRVTTPRGTAVSTEPFTVTPPADTGRPTVQALNAVSTRPGKMVTIRFRVTDPLPSCGDATVELVIKRRGGSVAWRQTIEDVPTNEDQSYRFRCPVKRGTYRYSLSCRDAAGNDGTGTSSKGFKVR